jgi:uncharacterized membrane protein
MDRLRLRPPLEGMHAMQAINAVVRNPPFGAGFFGMPVLCALVLLLLVPPGGRGGGGIVAAAGAAICVVFASS